MDIFPHPEEPAMNPEPLEEWGGYADDTAAIEGIEDELLPENSETDATTDDDFDGDAANTPDTPSTPTTYEAAEAPQLVRRRLWAYDQFATPIGEDRLVSHCPEPYMGLPPYASETEAAGHIQVAQAHHHILANTEGDTTQPGERGIAVTRAEYEPQTAPDGTVTIRITSEQPVGERLTDHTSWLNRGFANDTERTAAIQLTEGLINYYTSLYDEHAEAFITHLAIPSRYVITPEGHPALAIPDPNTARLDTADGQQALFASLDDFFEWSRHVSPTVTSEILTLKRFFQTQFAYQKYNQDRQAGLEPTMPLLDTTFQGMPNESAHDHPYVSPSYRERERSEAAARREAGQAALARIIADAQEAQPLLYVAGTNVHHIAERVDWSWGEEHASNYHHDAGIDPAVPGYIIRRYFYDGSGTRAPIEGLHRFYHIVDESEAQLHRLTHNTAVMVPDHFYVTADSPNVYTNGDSYHTAYMYTKELAGEAPDPANPAHEQHLSDIGSAIIAYLEGTPLGGIFTNEYLRLNQYIVGRHADDPSAPLHAYLHSPEYVEDVVMYRRVPAGQPQPEDTRENVFTHIVDDTRGWVRTLPPSARRDRLIQRLDALYIA